MFNSSTRDRLRIYFNNLFSFLLFQLMRLPFLKNITTGDKILFINTGLMGDVLMSTIFFSNESVLTNSREIFFLINYKYKDLFKDYNGQIKLIFWQEKKYRYNLLYRLKFLKELKSYNFFTSINLTFTRRILDDEISLLNGAKEKVCFQNSFNSVRLFSDYFDNLYTEILERRHKNHFIEYINFIKEYFCINEVKELTKIYFNQNDKNNKNSEIFDEDKLIVSIAPFSSRKIKNWSAEKFTNLINLILKEFNSQIILLGASIREGSFKDLEIKKDGITDLIGKTSLPDVISIIKRSDLFIGNDSGLFHMAKIFDIKRIGIIGGGAYGITFPYLENKNEILLYNKLDCFGCGWECIYSKPLCLEVDVDKVFNIVKKFLNANHESA